MKTAAVEWLANEIQEQLKMFFPGATLYQPTIEKAKEMEKQNIIESYCQGCFDMWKDNGIVPRETAEQYYNETFKSE
jgi:hypothetical protein